MVKCEGFQNHCPETLWIQQHSEREISFSLPRRQEILKVFEKKGQPHSTANLHSTHYIGEKIYLWESF